LSQDFIYFNKVTNFEIFKNSNYIYSIRGNYFSFFNGYSWHSVASISGGTYIYEILNLDSNNDPWYCKDSNIIGYYSSCYDEVYETIIKSKISDFDIDSNNQIWVGLYRCSENIGLVCYRTEPITQLSAYSTANSDLPDNDVYAVFCPKQDHVWVRTLDNLSLFNPSLNQWQVFNSIDIHCPYIAIYDIVSDRDGLTWLATPFGLITFDGNIFTNLNDTYSCLPDVVYSVAFDSANLIWIGTNEGMVRFDGSDCIVYDKTNSPFLCNEVTKVRIDLLDNKWLTTSNDFLYAYREGGVILNTDGISFAKQSIYPNPFNRQITVYNTGYNNIDNIQLLNSTGIVVKEYNVKNNSQVIYFDVEDIETGLYFLIVLGESSKSVYKMIKL
jgi:hypothetical protein